MTKVNAYRLLFEKQPAAGVNLFGSEEAVKQQIKRYADVVPTAAKKYSWRKERVDSMEQMVKALEPMREYKPPPPAGVKYKRGISCPKQGREHNYVLSPSGTYEKCTVCGSCRSLRKDKPDGKAKSIESKTKVAKGPTILHPKRQLLQKEPAAPIEKIPIPRWASKELPRGRVRERFDALLVKDNIAVIQDNKRGKIKILRRLRK
jgi:hypothetical protein